MEWKFKTDTVTRRDQEALRVDGLAQAAIIKFHKVEGSNDRNRLQMVLEAGVYEIGMLDNCVQVRAQQG